MNAHELDIFLRTVKKREEGLPFALKLLHGAFDHFESVVEILKRGSKYSSNFSINDNDIRRCIIEIAIALEQLFKSKILLVDWGKVFSLNSQVTLDNLKNGTFKSIPLTRCIEQIEALEGITIEPAIKEDIDKLANVRNKKVHYFHEIREDEFFLSIVFRSMDIFIEFYKEHLFVDIYEEVDRTRKVDEQLSEVPGYPAMRLKTLVTKYQQYQIPRTHFFCECQTCLQDVFVLSDHDSVLCIFCGREENIEAKARDVSKLNGATKLCPECGRKSMTATFKSTDEPESWDCILCGFYIGKSYRWWNWENDSNYIDSIKDECRLLPRLPFKGSDTATSSPT